ncbi:unnamed protein product, partial [Prorocentrum cordatum]
SPYGNPRQLSPSRSGRKPPAARRKSDGPRRVPGGAHSGDRRAGVPSPSCPVAASGGGVRSGRWPPGPARLGRLGRGRLRRGPRGAVPGLWRRRRAGRPRRGPRAHGDGLLQEDGRLWQEGLCGHLRPAVQRAEDRLHHHAGPPPGQAEERRAAHRPEAQRRLLRQAQGYHEVPDDRGGQHGRIKTTYARALGVQSFIDRMIVLAKRGDDLSRREAEEWMVDSSLVENLFKLAPERYGDKGKDFTQVTRTMGKRGAEMAYIELV